ncbi:VCBS repeat-containing protein [uncultured Algibacter sp.]|uniref:VCBS repeat-containing protein n=1 Tax=uncultured Algibacter sp. TaxID=298659 RepID=UPI002601895B|nr:VCBS repeat-containing protein [uncultured Algibacter sp.]
MIFKNYITILISVAFIFGCKPKDTNSNIETTLFSIVSETESNINFTNTIQQDYNLNFINYPYIYNGGGVAIGDFNNDGLQDIYLTANQNSNKLYLNKGDFKFEDITKSAHVEDAQGWTTGVSVIDINNDGFLDIYVCKSASIKHDALRKNKLYINQGDLTFKEEAKKWGLDNYGYSTQSYFFDYDKDGDLDMYLVSHRPDFNMARQIDKPEYTTYYYELSDQLYRNDQNTFVNVTEEAGLINKAWGLSASIGDFNNDGWDDIYVGNDYIQPDHLYINNQNGTFTDDVLNTFKHISYNSMGSDYADINNDLLPDLLVLDMSAEDHKRSKENMATMSTKGFEFMVKHNYHHSYMANVLQLNNGNGTFKDIGQLVGVSKTDWSWAPLIADYDNDGYKDIFVSNGIERDLANQDYKKNVASNPAKQTTLTLKDAINLMPATKLPNYVLKNNGNLTFEKMTKAWGLDKAINTNGVAYADLDNDGDLDLVCNNLSDKAIVYKNNSTNNYIKIKLKGGTKNLQAIGSKVSVFSEHLQQSQENYNSRGFQSSVSDVLNFGLHTDNVVNKIEVIWGDGKTSVLKNIKANQTIIIDKNSIATPINKPKKEPLFTSIDPTTLGINYSHQENVFDDFKDQVLLPQKQSAKGPTIAVADINNDGLDDFFVGGAKDQPSSIFIQTSSGKFKATNSSLFKKDASFEDQDADFFDADNDGDLDLLVSSGGYEFSEDEHLLKDRLYLNNGKGHFSKNKSFNNIKTSTKSITPFDFDDDGDMDLLIGGQVVPNKYPLATNSYVLRNDDGKFIDVTLEVASEFQKIGLVNDITLSDFDNDGDTDFFVVGEWMPLTLFENNNGHFTKLNTPSFSQTEGWWNTTKAIDIDGDGDEDYIVGNLGDNNKFKPTAEKPLHIYANHFDDNASYDMLLSKKYKGTLVPTRGKECSSQQTPFLNQKIQSYNAFANASLTDIYGEDNINEAYHLKAHTFSSSLIINNGNGSFTIKKLPATAQVGPTLSFEIMDINNDGHLDILGMGAIHEAEVETIRYDGNTGYILLGDSKGNFNPKTDISFYESGNVKDMKKIIINNDTYLIIANNNQPLRFLKVL